MKGFNWNLTPITWFGFMKGFNWNLTPITQLPWRSNPIYPVAGLNRYRRIYAMLALQTRTRGGFYGSPMQVIQHTKFTNKKERLSTLF
jgi:hypothetical protein